MRLQVFTAPLFALAIIPAIIVAKSEVMDRNAVENIQGTKNGREGSRPVAPNDSKDLRIESGHEITDQGSSPSGTTNRENSQALNSFLRNVLRAQDELKWIDDRVDRRLDGIKYAQERSSRYHRTPRQDPDKARSKRRSGYELEENESWPSSNNRKTYYDYEDSGNRLRGVYPDDETEIKREAREGPRVSESWSEYNEDNGESWRGERHASDLKVQNESSSKNDLESLRRTVLALSRSLEESDKKVDEPTENELQGVAAESKDREGHVGGIFRRNEDRAKDAQERDDRGGDLGQASGVSSSGSSWWDDPRTAVDMFDFKRRDDDEGMDDEDEDEDSDPGMSEFDYNAMRRVKREKDNEEGEPGAIRVYGGAGFGAPHHEGGGGGGGYERRKRRSGYEKDAEELPVGNGNVSREISGEAMAAVMRDKVINELADGAEMRRIVNANDRTVGKGDGEVVNKNSEAKNSGEYDNTAGGNPGEVKDTVTEDRGKRRETRRNDITDDESASKNELVKTPESETSLKEIEVAKQEVQKSQASGYEVMKLSTDSNEVKKDEEQMKRDGVNGDTKTPGEVKMTDATRVEKSTEKSEDSNEVKIVAGNQSESRTEKNNDETEDRKPKVQEDSKSVIPGDVKEENVDNEIHSKSDFELTRKLLWLSEMDESSFDLKNNREKFARRSLMALKERKLRRRRKTFGKNSKRSVKSYPESVEADNTMEEASREDKQDVHRSETRKRSVRRIIEHRRDPDLAEDVYEVEVEDDGDAGQDDEKNSLKETRAASDDDGEAELALVSFASSDTDRDPIRDRINMLIKQKLDDRGKGKLVHVKREANDPTRIIEYYDYDNDENEIDSEANPSLAESDQAQNSTVSGEGQGNETASTGGGNTILKTDENAEEEKKQEENKNSTINQPPKEEFISNIDTSKTETTKPPSSGVEVTTIAKPAIDEGQRTYGEDGNFQDEESRNESGEHHEDRAVKSSDSRWLGESQDQDSRNEKSRDDQPFEYSVNVHGKVEPDSIGDAKDRLKGSDEDWKYNDGIQDGKEVENEELDKERAARRDWRYGDSTRTEEGSNSSISSEDSSFSSSSSSSSSDDNERERIPDDKRYSEDTAGDQENLSSQEARLTDDDESALDSLRTMLDRSGPRQPELSGERTYLVIAPPQSQCPRKTSDVNEKTASSSSGSSYSALKITDDMFKGGIEQSNPVSDMVNDGDSYGITTTEWTVIKPGGNEEKSRYQDLVMSPLDVVHESIVDPDEMAADFDDDTRPRLGRSLQSISYPRDPFYRVEVNGDTERPVEKYLEYTQNGYNNDKVTVHRIVKRDSAIVSNDEQESLSQNTSLLGQDKDNKRGLTNVEEWEMNAPTVQKQRSDSPEVGKARETRSVRLKDDSVEQHDQKSVELIDGMRSKIRPSFDDPNFRDNSRENDDKWSNYRRSSIRRDHQLETFKGRESDADLSKQNDYRRSRYNRRKSDRGLSPSRKHHLNRLKQQRRLDENRDFIHETNGLRPVARNPDESPRLKDARFVDREKTTAFGGTKRVLDENAVDLTNIKPKKDNQKKKLKMLLATDNMADESQMDLALHGELAGKIVQKIFDQVQRNNALKVALGPGLFQKHKSEDAAQTDKTYRRGLDEDEVKHTETMMRRVMELLGRLILDEVQRKTCTSLPPDMREFLQWMLRVDDDDKPSDQVPPLPLVHNQEPHHHRTGKFLFGNSSSGNENVEVDEVNRKVRLLKSLIEEYNSLTAKEKTKVQAVHDYLVEQLRRLLEYIEKKQAGDDSNDGGKLRDLNILQYQNAVPTANETVTPRSTLSPLANGPSLMMLSNATFNIDQPYRPSSNSRFFGQLRPRRREARSSVGEVEKKHKKHEHKHHHSDHENNKGKKKHKHKHKKKHKPERHAGGESGAETPEYRKLIRRAAMMRRKRANLYEDAWDPLDSGYEEPVIYSASGKLASGSGKRRRSPEAKDQVKRDVISASVALEPWLNPKSEDPMTSGYLNQLTDRLVRESLTPPVYEERKSASGRSLADDEVMLLSKREAWRNENEQQLEEVAFGKDMRGKWKDEERFKKLTDIDRMKKIDDGIGRQKREGDEKRNSSSEADTLESAHLSQVVKNDEVDNGTSTVKDENLVIKQPTNSDNMINRKSTITESLRTEDSEPDSLDSKLSSLVSGARNEQSSFPLVQEHVESRNDEDKISRTEDKQQHSTISRDLESKGPDQSTENHDEKESSTRMNAMSKDNFGASEEPIDKRKGKRSFPFVISEAEGSPILPLLEVSEQREQQKQATKTEADDQRDIADQVLGLDSPLLLGLNTY